MTSKHSLQNTVTLKILGIANFAGIIKIAVMLIKTLKKSLKVKKIIIYVIKWNFHLLFPKCNKNW